MGIWNIFSKRQRRVKGKVPDIYVYDDISEAFRVQVIHILMDAFGPLDLYETPCQKVWASIHSGLCREYGVFGLTKDRSAGPHEHVCNFLLAADDHERVLDVIEVAFRHVMSHTDDWSYRDHACPRVSSSEAITELNARFIEHGIGYQFAEGLIIRQDSQMLHAEAVKPALELLQGKEFRGANEEFIKAYEHYRHGRNKEALNDALKALESVLKIICTKRGWSYQATDTAKPLLDLCFVKGLFPDFLASHLGALRAALESGVPTIRNKMGGHGQGATPVAVPNYVTAYTLHLTAAAIVFLVQAHNDTK